jgi:acetate---CoA ligase (ADP-forming)
VDSPERWTSLLNPESVLIVGASAERYYSKNLITRLRRSRVAGHLHLVNPNRDQVLGLPTVPAVSAVKESVDVALVLVRAERALDAVRDCAAVGVRACIVVTSAPNDPDGSGRDMSARLREIAASSGMLLIGPSTLGVMSLTGDVELFAGGEFGTPFLGRVAVASQSGGLLQSCIAEGQLRAVGFSYLVNVGAAACTGVEDVLEYAVSDERTQVFCGIAEQFANPEALVRSAILARRHEKPVVMLKLGRSEAGARMARSHTGAMTGFDRFSDALFRDLGILRVSTIEEMFDTVSWLLTRRPRQAAVRNLAIVSLSGGVAGAAADLLGGSGIAVPELSEGAQAQVKKVANLAEVGNPLELGRQIQTDHPAVWPALLQALGEEASCDALLTFDLGVDQQRVRSLSEWSASTGKPAGLSDIGVALTRRDAAAAEILSGSGLAAPVGPGSAVRGLLGLRQYEDWLRLPRSWPEELLANWPRSTRRTKPVSDGRASGAIIADRQARTAFADVGIPSPVEQVTTTAQQAVQAAEEIGYPVVLKVAAPGLAHRTELSLVRTGLADRSLVRAAADELLRRAEDDVIPDAVLLVQQMVRGVELVISVDNTRGFAPLVLVGRGGELVEIERDRVFAVGPISADRARGLLAGLQVAPVFAGFRGRPPADLDAAARAVAALSAFCSAHWDRVAVAEINPLIAMPGTGAVAVDGLIEMRSS